MTGSFELNDVTMAAVEEIRVALNLPNNAAVLRRAIAMLRVLVKYTQQGKVVIVSPEGDQHTIIIE